MTKVTKQEIDQTSNFNNKNWKLIQKQIKLTDKFYKMSLEDYNPELYNFFKKYEKYDTFIEDSLLTGNISTTIQLPSKSLIEQTFSYTPKFPKRILRVDTVKIETTIETTIRNERNILVGVGIGASKNNLSINLGGGFRDKQGRDYFYHFDMLQKSHNFGIQIPLRWR